MFFYEGQILHFYETSHNTYCHDVQIEKFIRHYDRETKEPYISARIRDLDGFKTHIQTYTAKNCLGVFFLPHKKSFKNFY